MTDLTEAKCQLDVMLDEIRDLRAERENLKKCCDNMAANAEMYRNLLKNPDLSDYSQIECKALAIAWQEASDMLADAMAGGKG